MESKERVEKGYQRKKCPTIARHSHCHMQRNFRPSLLTKFCARMLSRLPAEPPRARVGETGPCVSATGD